MQIDYTGPEIQPTTDYTWIWFATAYTENPKVGNYYIREVVFPEMARYAEAGLLLGKAVEIGVMSNDNAHWRMISYYMQIHEIPSLQFKLSIGGELPDPKRIRFWPDAFGLVATTRSIIVRPEGNDRTVEILHE